MNEYVKIPLHYSLLAALFDYPDLDFVDRVRRLRKHLGAKYPVAVADLDQFIELLPEDNLLTMQELFTRSFDVQAVATLDIGYVLFGDDYKRGEMLANLNREHLAASNDCGTELADHLPNLLRLMDRLSDEDLIRDLAYAVIAPALLDMIGEFSPGRVQKKNEANTKHYKTLIDTPPVQNSVFVLYKFALRALYEVLKQDFSLIQSIPLARSSDFLESVNRENVIEGNANAFG
jgi:nitrate reductase assembly molybdenum cofactor insertion protein NarJ